MSYINSLKARISNAIVESAARAIVEQASPSLVNQMKKIAADNFVFYYKAYAAHWNVEGENFPQYHDFFADIYKSAEGNIDGLAEQIRALGEYAPASLKEVMALTVLDEFDGDEEHGEMLTALGGDLQKLIDGLMVGQRLAEAEKEVGLADFLQGIIDANKKTAWMIKSTLKEESESQFKANIKKAQASFKSHSGGKIKPMKAKAKKVGK